MLTPPPATARHLLRLWNSVPIPKATQGSTLSIRSLLEHPCHVVIQPDWRDNAHAELKQVFDKHSSPQESQRSPQVDMTIRYEGDLKTSIGRDAPHISITLQTPSKDVVTHTKASSSNTAFNSTTTSKTTEKVMLDDGTILPDAPEFAAINLTAAQDGSRRIEYHDGIAHIHKESNNYDPSELPGTYLTLQVPEKLNLICELVHGNGSDSRGGGSITIEQKLEGDVKLLTQNGDIRVTKLRGHSIELCSTGEGNSPVIYVKDLLEAQKISLETTGRVRAKQIHGNKINIAVKAKNDPMPTGESILEDSDDDGSLIDIGALFVSERGGATIDVSGPCQLSRRAIRIKSNHGPVQVRTHKLTQPIERNKFTDQLYPILELGGVNGNCEVSMEGTNLCEDSGSDTWTSCNVHFDSFSAESVSIITSDCGDVSVTLDRKVEADLRLLSARSTDSLVETTALLAEEEDSNLLLNVLRHIPSSDSIDESAKSSPESRISIQTKAFTQRRDTLHTESIEYIDGWVDNKSHEPDSRFDRKIHRDSGAGINTGIGKIRLESAADQALKSFTSPDRQTSGDADRGSDHSADTDDDYRPLAVVVSTGRILVETVSWLGAIARRYGLEEDKKEPGRTAARKGRLSVLPEQ